MDTKVIVNNRAMIIPKRALVLLPNKNEWCPHVATKPPPNNSKLFNNGKP